MQMWRAVCLDGFTKEVQAATREEACRSFLKDPDVLNHMKNKHPELKGKSREYLNKWVLALVQIVV